MRRSVLALAGCVAVASLALAITTPTARSRTTKAPSHPVAVESAALASPERDEQATFDPSFSRAVDLPPAHETPSSQVRAMPLRTAPTSRARVPRGQSTQAAPTVGAKAGDSVTDFLADSLFRQLDTNGDGVLTGTEIPTAYRAAAGARGVIDRQTFAPLFRATVQKLRNTPAAVPAGAGATRAGELPQWFATLDPEGTGQVTLHSWRTAGRGTAEFQQIDANSDGLLTRREVLTFAAQSRVNGSTSGGAGTRAGSAHATPTSSESTVTGGAKTTSRADALLGHYGAIAARSLAQIPRAQTQSAAGAVAGGGGGAVIPAASGAPAPTPTPPPPAQSSDPAADTEVATLPLPLIDNDYWVMRNNDNLGQLYAGERPSVLFLGDSITDFLQNDAGGPVWDEYYAPLGAMDFGVAAVRTSHVLWQVESGQVAVAAPKVVVLLIGSNNLGLGQDPTEVAAGVAKIVYELGVHAPDTRVLLLGLLPRGFSPDDPFRAQIAEVNSMISYLDDGDRVNYMDIGWLFPSSDGWISPDVMSDGAHPTLWGYQLYTAQVLPAIKELLDQ